MAARWLPAAADALGDDLRQRAFAPRPPDGAPRVGVEVELIPVDEATRTPVPIDGAPTAMLPIVRDVGAGRGWVERRSAKAGVAELWVPGGGRLTFEPGGQLEYSSPPLASASAVLRDIEATIVPVVQAAADRGVRLLGVGVDPHTPLDRAPLRLDAPRYRCMDAYFRTLGPAGQRMMRQTAAVQISVDGDAPGENFARWRVLNALAPLFSAIFANSPCYAGQPTGHRSYRRHIWATLDPRRTGLVGYDGDPVAEYLSFALAAPAILRPDAPHRPFAEWLADGATTRDWAAHLTTLFPEIRPRGAYELRSPDAIAPEWYAAPIALVVGLVYHAPSLAAAADLLPAPDSDRLARAGRCALRDPSAARLAAALVDIALDGCAALGDDVLHPHDLDVARAFFDRYTRRGRTPADDLSE